MTEHKLKEDSVRVMERASALKLDRHVLNFFFFFFLLFVIYLAMPAFSCGTRDLQSFAMFRIFSCSCGTF